MTYNLILKTWDSRDAARDRELITKTFRHYVRTQGLDRFEARLDVACLEIAETLGYVFEREGDDLLFIQRGLQ